MLGVNSCLVFGSWFSTFQCTIVILMHLYLFTERRDLQGQKVQCYLSFLWLSSSGLIAIEIRLWLCLCKLDLVHYLSFCPLLLSYWNFSFVNQQIVDLKSIGLLFQVLGHIGYHIIVAGLNGYMATVNNLKNPVNKWRCGAAPITVGFQFLLLMMTIFLDHVL